MNELMRTILNLPPQSSTMAYEVDALHYFVIIVTMLGAAGVALACFVFIFRYRQRAGRGDPAPDERPLHTTGGVPFWAEGIVVVGLLGLFTLWWVLGFRQYTVLQTPPPDAIDVYVVGKKWMWSFAYPSGGGSNAVMYVPVHRPVRVVLTSRDVIHSFYVPAFRIKQDAVPGRVTTAWFEATEVGTYELLCAEFCGTGHSTMRGQIVVLSDADYARMLEQLPRVELAAAEYREPAVPGDLPREPVTMAQMGERVAAAHGCLRCHTVDGAPHIGPTWARAYGSTVTTTTGRRVVVDEAYLTESMMDPRAHIHRGFAPVMPSYQGLLTAGETGALVEYIRSLRDVPPATRLAPLAPPVTEPVELPRAPAERLPEDPP